MELHQIVGVVLAVVGVLDLIFARLLIGPRIPGPRRRRIVVGVVSLGGFVLFLLGGLFMVGWISF